VALAILALYALLALVAASNALLLPRVRPRPGPTPGLAVLVPARDEAENLAALLPLGADTYVYDDQSSDGTAEVAAGKGAKVVRGGSLPEGWAGKPHACHRLAQVAAEDSPAKWWAFVDADVRTSPEGLAGLAAWCEAEGRSHPVLTGFLRVLPGKGLEPGFLAWVWWILLATNPFGLVSRARTGHNGFTNGQITIWSASRYWEVRPHESVKGLLLEDVAIGRLLARQRVRVAVADLSAVASVRMYDDVGGAWRGMAKNAGEIAGGRPGSTLLALGLATAGWGWAAAGPWAWHAFGLFAVSQAAAIAVTRMPLWTVLTMPLSLSAGAACVAWSAWGGRRARIWKGRAYD
jgi:glycosyltransferase involved in cell wall biosynthesis